MPLRIAQCNCMSKRKLSHQQLRRIKANKDSAEIRLQNQSLNDNENIGLLISRSSNKALIRSIDGKLIQCDIRRNLKTLASGDRIIWQQESDQAVITACLQRSSELSRPDKYGKIKVIAANIDQVFIVCAPLPEVSTLLIDSYLVACNLLCITPVIVFNKVDLEHHSTIVDAYTKLGYQVIKTSTYDAFNLLPLSQLMANKTNVLVGQSGVGKSSLINQLIPEASEQTQAISEQSKLGKHTTSHSYLYELPSSGYIIDSPGIREFTLGEASKDQIFAAFPELKNSLGRCKFSNCTHTHEPSCAILSAVEDGTISQDRFENLNSLLLKVIY